MKYIRMGIPLLAFLLVALPALADEPTAASNAVAIDTVWTLIAAFLVFFMQAGFAMVETGFNAGKKRLQYYDEKPDGL